MRGSERADGARLHHERLGVFRGAGLGVQYKYNKYAQARGIGDTKLGGEITFQGVQVFLSFRF